MNKTNIIASLTGLSNDRNQALHLIRQLYRDVHQSNFERSICCSNGGVFYISYRPDESEDVRVLRLQACDFGIPIGPEFAESNDGYESFDDIPDDVWDGEVAGLQDHAAELAYELQNQD